MSVFAHLLVSLLLEGSKERVSAKEYGISSEATRAPTFVSVVACFPSRFISCVTAVRDIIVLWLLYNYANTKQKAFCSFLA